MAVVVTQEATKYTWGTNGYSFGEYKDTWGEAAKTSTTVTATESTVFQERAKRKVAISNIEQFGLLDLFKRGASRRFFESFSLAEGFDKQSNFKLSISENMSLVASDNALSGRPVWEDFGFKESYSLNCDKRVGDEFGFKESFLTNFVIARTPIEQFGLTEKIGSARYRRFYEHIGIADNLIRASEGVLSGIRLNKVPMEYEDFLEYAKTPTLYNPFVEFRVGEYEYQDAIVKIRFNTTSKESSPSLTFCKMHIDIPDTDDKGTVEITDTKAPTKVYFNKFYYNPPEVVVVLRGGNTADGILTPNLVSTDKEDSEGRYFEVELFDAVGERKKGSISWVAKGY